MFKPTDIAHESGLFGPTPELERLANLTKIASLPGSGGGCMSALQAEKNEAPQPKVQMKSPYFDDLDWPSIVFLDEEPGE